MFTVIEYTHVALTTPLFRHCHAVLQAAIDAAAQSEPMAPDRILVTSAPHPVLPGWRNIVATGQHGLHDCYVKIVAGLEAARHETVFLVEYDALYPLPYFDFSPPTAEPETWWYNMHVWRQNAHGFWRDPTLLTSQLCAHRAPLLDLFRARLAKIGRGERIVWDEPGRDPGDRGTMKPWNCPQPSVDIRWGGNLTGHRKGEAYSAELEPWGKHADRWRAYGLELPQPVPVAPQQRVAGFPAPGGDRRFV